MGTRPGLPGVRHLFRVGDPLATETSDLALSCITCENSLTLEPSTESSLDISIHDEIGVEQPHEARRWQKCEYNEVSMSPSLEFFVQVSLVI